MVAVVAVVVVAMLVWLASGLGILPCEFFSKLAACLDL